MKETLADRMDVEIAVDKHNHVYFFYNKGLQTKIDYAMYDMVKSELSLVNEEGRLLDVGIKVSKPIYEHIQLAHDIRLLEMKGDTLLKTVDVPLIIQKFS